MDGLRTRTIVHGHRIPVDTRGVNVLSSSTIAQSRNGRRGGIKTGWAMGSGAGTRVLVVDGEAVGDNGWVAGAVLG